jgi:lysophospholipase L1-like esterase
MSKISGYLAILTAVLITLALVIFQPPTRATAANPIRIMPLGDSITGSPGCWRALLWNQLQNAGFTNIDFVGTLGPQGCGVPYDGDNEGHGGALVTNVANQNQLVGWLSATNPDIVLMHFGTNDVWNAIPPATILAAYRRLVDQMRANNPGMTILVQQIIPMNPNNCAECGSRVVALNQQIPAWASALSTTQSPIIVVDQWTGFSAAADTGDGVHPNDSGIRKMADRLFPAVSSVLSRTPPTTTTTTTTTPGGATCTATYTIVSQWQGAFQGEVTVRAGSRAITGWTVGFSFTGGQLITQSWNTRLTQTSAAVSATNLDWNGSLGAGASTTFGFLANWNGTNPVPVPTCTAR